MPTGSLQPAATRAKTISADLAALCNHVPVFQPCYHPYRAQLEFGAEDHIYAFIRHHTPRIRGEAIAEETLRRFKTILKPICLRLNHIASMVKPMLG
jgi:hypothetical protein